MNSCTFQRIDDLDVLRRSGQADDRCIVMLHGFGANFADLSGLADMLDPQQNWAWYFPNGILEVRFNDAFVGRSWFPINLEEREEKIRKGLRDDPNETPDGLVPASLRIASLFKTLSTKYQKIVVGGFSQGAMLSCDAALTSDVPVSGLLQLSGKMLAGKRWGDALHLRPKNFPILQAHGLYDAVLGYEGATALADFFKKQNFPHEFHPFNGGHEIPMPVLRAVQAYLGRFTQG